MSMDVTQRFELGETLDGTDSAGTTLINKEILGSIRRFPDKRLGVSSIRGSKTRSVERWITAVALRNTSGQALLPKRIVSLAPTAGFGDAADQESLLTAADGYANTIAQGPVAVVDEFLPSAGVADDDIFWGIIKGRCLVLTPTVDSEMAADISVGDYLISASAGTSGNTTSGRIRPVTFIAATSGNTLATSNAFFMAVNRVGIALSAKTSQQTTDGQDMLCNLNISHH